MNDQNGVKMDRISDNEGRGGVELPDNSLTIAFDAKRITHNGTGLGNYGRTVIRMLQQYAAPENRYLLYTPGPGQEQLRNRLVEDGQLTYRYPHSAIIRRLGERLGGSFWRTCGIARELPAGVQLFHGLTGELPFGLARRGVRSVVTVHDLIFLRFPSLYKAVDRWIYTGKCRSACQRADRVIAISEMTRRDLIDIFGIPEEKIDVVYQGCDDQFKRTVDDAELLEVRKRYALPERYLLSVGTIETRKNLLLVAQAMTRIDISHHLVVVGRRTPYAQQIEEFAARNGLGGRLHIIDTVRFADLPALYRMAELFVYPSRYEGFGIPMIEAANCSVPTIGAAGSSLEEAGGPGAIYVDPDDPAQLAAEIERVIGDESLRQRMVADGVEYVKRFEAPVIVAELLDVYRKTLL